jgi:hypothetical protein
VRLTRRTFSVAGAVLGSKIRSLTHETLRAFRRNGMYAGALVPA